MYAFLAIAVRLFIFGWWSKIVVEYSTPCNNNKSRKIPTNIFSTIYC